MTGTKPNNGLADARAAITEALDKLNRAAALCDAARALDDARDIRAVASSLRHVDAMRLARRPGKAKD